VPVLGLEDGDVKAAYKIFFRIPVGMCCRALLRRSHVLQTCPGLKPRRLRCGTNGELEFRSACAGEMR